MHEHQSDTRQPTTAPMSSQSGKPALQEELLLLPGPWSARQTIQLQRLIGNAAVNRLLNTRTLIQRDAAESFGQTIGGVTPLVQPSSKACWATVTTMMASYNDATAYGVADIPSVVGRAGARYTQIYTADSGLSSEDKAPFLAAMGFSDEPPASYLPRAVYDMMASFGPLWITTDGGTLDTVHARVLIGMGGDGSATGTTMQIIDPADGAIHGERYDVFARRYSNVGSLDASQGLPFRAQIVHW